MVPRPVLGAPFVGRREGTQCGSQHGKSKSCSIEASPVTTTRQSSSHRPSSKACSTTARRAERMSKAMQMPRAVKASQVMSGAPPFDSPVHPLSQALVEALALDGAALAVAVPAGFHEALQALGLGERTSVSLALHLTMAPVMKALDVRGIIRATHREGRNVIPLHRQEQLFTADGAAFVLAAEDLGFLGLR